MAGGVLAQHQGMTLVSTASAVECVAGTRVVLRLPTTDQATHAGFLSPSLIYTVSPGALMWCSLDTGETHLQGLEVPVLEVKCTKEVVEVTTPTGTLRFPPVLPHKASTPHTPIEGQGDLLTELVGRVVGGDTGSWEAVRRTSLHLFGVSESTSPGPWSQLVSSRRGHELRCRAGLPGVVSTQVEGVLSSPTEHQDKLMDLALIYESFKVCTLTQCYLAPLGRVLATVSRACAWHAYALYYAHSSDLGLHVLPAGGSSADFKVPFDVYRWIQHPEAQDDFLERLLHSLPIDTTNTLLQLATVLHLHGLLANKPSVLSAHFPEPPPALSCDAQVLWTMARVEFSLELLPYGMALPLYEALHRLDPAPVLALAATLPLDQARAFTHTLHSLTNRPDLAASYAPPTPPLSLSLENLLPSSTPEEEHVFELSKLRFADSRLEQALGVLRTDTKVTVRVSDDSTPQAALLPRVLGALSGVLGRGMLTLGSVSSPLVTRKPVPPLCITGLVLPAQASVSLDPAALPPNLLSWPSFHNGAAASICLSGPVTRAWILYNRPSDPYTHGGLLLGLGLSNRLNLSKPDLAALLAEQHPGVSTGVLLGLGAQHAGTQDLTVSRVLSSHLPLEDSPVHTPEVYAAAVLGLGLVYRATGARFMMTVLVGELDRAPRSGPDHGPESYGLAAGLALGMVGLGRGDALAGVTDTLTLLAVGGRRRNVRPASTRYLEAETVTSAFCTPGALLALGLLYFDTADPGVLGVLGLPRTRALLDEIHPHHLLLRVLARHLVSWTAIRPTEQWVRTGGVPHCVTASEAVLVQCAGVLALGLRYAGCATSSALHVCLALLEDWDTESRGRGHARAHRHALQTGVAVSVVSAALIMAGTGNLRLSARLHALLATDLPYELNSAVRMALGLMYLGAGRYSLSNSATAIPVLLCAVFPLFPRSASDNRLHLQAFRHLYVLAVECRELATREISTQESVSVPITVVLRDTPGLRFRTHRVELVTPALLPPLTAVASITLRTPRYHPATLSMDNPVDRHLLTEAHVLYVKKRPGCLSYLEDPRGVKGVSSRPFPRAALVDSPGQDWRHAARRQFVASFSGDPALLTFTSHFNSEFASEALYDCLIADKPEALDLYLAVQATLAEVLSEQLSSVHGLCNLKLVLSRPRPGLLQPEYLEAVAHTLDQYFYAKLHRPDLLAYLEGGPSSPALRASVCYYEVPAPGTLQRLVAECQGLATTRVSDLVPVLDCLAPGRSPASLLYLAHVVTSLLP